MEKIYPYAISPWEDRLQVTMEVEREMTTQWHQDLQGIVIAISSSERNGLTGIGGAICDTRICKTQTEPFILSKTIGRETKQNLYTAELRAAAECLYCIQATHNREIFIYTNNRSVLQMLNNPCQQSGQDTIQKIYQEINALRSNGNIIQGIWIPRNTKFQLEIKAKAAAKEATRQGNQPDQEQPQTKAKLKRTALKACLVKSTLPLGIGKFTKEIDKALPGRQTRTLYDALTYTEAAVLVQLRTGISRLNHYLHKINAAETKQCECGIAEETVKHFLFRCTKWDALRSKWEPEDRTKRGNLSFAIGGKSHTDTEPWVPDMNTVRKTIQFAIATKRLEPATNLSINATQQA